jgi:hypothetical protein
VGRERGVWAGELGRFTCLCAAYQGLNECDAIWGAVGGQRKRESVRPHMSMFICPLEENVNPFCNGSHDRGWLVVLLLIGAACAGKEREGRRKAGNGRGGEWPGNGERVGR